jgi:group II intron reverse transcriptase/maturase
MEESPMNVGEMQRKLSLWAEKDKDLRFFDLYHLLHDMNWLRLAHDHVSQNAGSVTAGCDGIDMEGFDKDLERNLEELGEELKTQTFEPLPVRRVYIPKANGKVRPLGIPAIRDRIVQEAVRMVLEPIYEAEFSQYSFGFRPNRRTMDAIKCIIWSTQEHKKYFLVIEGDISVYFDTINHKKLMKLLESRITDRKLLTLTWKFLRSGVMERKLFKDTRLGTPQGGIISPLLANVYLSELDKYIRQWTVLPSKEKTARRTKGQGNYVYVRYADDFVILSNGSKEQAEELKQNLRQFLKEKLSLELSEEKTKITHLNDGFEFLGFRIQRSTGAKGMTTKVLIPKESVDKLRNKIKLATDRSQHQDSVNNKILALNRIINGWCAYYQYTSQASTIFSHVDQEVFWSMAHFLGRKFQLTMPQVLKRFGNPRLGTKEHRLVRAYEKFPTRQYKIRFLKPNPYTTQEVVTREELSGNTFWSGYEPRPGMADLRPLILERDEYLCQMCENQVTPETAQVDHIRPVRRFRRPIDANMPENLQTLCVACHRKKTEVDRRMESPVR